MIKSHRVEVLGSKVFKADLSIFLGYYALTLGKDAEKINGFFELRI